MFWKVRNQDYSLQWMVFLFVLQLNAFIESDLPLIFRLTLFDMGFFWTVSHGGGGHEGPPS